MSENNYLIIETETNGLPGKGNPGILNFPRYQPRLVQLGWALFDAENGLSIEDSIIKANRFKIENERYHGISLEKSKAEGISILEKLDILLKIVSEKSPTLVGYNLRFHRDAIVGELIRHKDKLDVRAIVKFIGTNGFDVMEFSRSFHPNGHCYKLPEFYKLIKEQDFPKLETKNLSDIHAVSEIFANTYLSSVKSNYHYELDTDKIFQQAYDLCVDSGFSDLYSKYSAFSFQQIKTFVKTEEPEMTTPIGINSSVPETEKTKEEKFADLKIQSQKLNAEYKKGKITQNEYRKRMSAINKGLWQNSSDFHKGAMIFLGISLAFLVLVIVLSFILK